MAKMGNDKAKWRNWLHKLKNILGDTIKDESWSFWMDVAEKNFKEPHEIKDQGEIADSTGQQKFNYETVAKGLKTLLTEKLEDDTDGFLIIKRNEDGLRGYAEVYRHHMELTGEGLNDKMGHILQPQKANKDEDVLRAVEIWEDEYKDALMRGMPKLEDPFKITIIVKKIATDSIRKEMEAKV